MAKRKRSRARRAARTAGRYAMSGVKGAALQAGTGAVVNLGQTALATRVPFVAQNWWAAPAGIALLGLLMKRRPRLRGLGDAMLGAAGYAGALGYTYSKASVAAGGEAGALYEPSAVYDPDTGMLVGSGGYGALADANNPTSSHYVPSDAREGDVSAALAL